MFKLKHISETFSDPSASICDIGRFDGPATTFADLVFVRDGIDTSRTYINSKVLRSLLLSNPKLLAKATGLAVLDADAASEMVTELNMLRKQNEELKIKLGEDGPPIRRKKVEEN